MTSKQDQIVAYDPENLKESQGYEHELRAVGQALEKDPRQSFEVKTCWNHLDT